MTSFPKSEDSVMGLAQVMSTGLGEHSEVYPEPPVTSLTLKSLWTALADAKAAAATAQAQAEAATLAKVEALETLIGAMKKDIRYAENLVNFEDDKLKLIGWGAPKPPAPMPAPGQTRSLHIVKQGEGWVQLEWSAPIDGGKVSAYRVLRRERPAGLWEDVAMAVETKAALVDQPRGKELEFRIVAVNKTGEGEPSNTEMVVL